MRGYPSEATNRGNSALSRVNSIASYIASRERLKFKKKVLSANLGLK
jgi:hypothetical protein